MSSLQYEDSVKSLARILQNYVAKFNLFSQSYSYIQVIFHILKRHSKESILLMEIERCYYKLILDF